MEDPAVVCAVEGQGKAGGGMMDPTTAMPDPNSRSSSPGQHSPFDAAKHFPVIQEPAPQGMERDGRRGVYACQFGANTRALLHPGYFVHQPAYMMAPAHMAPQNIVYDAAGVPYVPYIPPVQQMPVPQMLRCYPVVQVNPQVNQQVNQQIHPQIHQQTYRSAGEPRQVHRPQGYCSAGEPGRAATLRMVAPTRGGSARVLTELSPAEVRTAFRSPPPHMQQQPQHVAGVATMVGAVPHAVRNGTRYQPASGPQYIQLPAGQLRPMAYASDPNLGARVLLSGSRRGHSAGSRVVLHDSFATVSDAPDGRNSPTVVLSSAASGSFSQPGDNRPTIAAANPYVCTPARRTVPNPFAAHCAGAPMGPARLGSGFSLTSSQSHVMEPAGICFFFGGGVVDGAMIINTHPSSQRQMRSPSPRPRPTLQCPPW